MRRFFHLYEYLGPAVLTPLAVFLWWRHYGNVSLTILAIAVPIVHAYIVPGIGTNVLKMWAFSSRFRIGRFRPQHGFVFGSATAVLALPFMGQPGDGDILWTGVRLGVVLLVVNWVYDAIAIKNGILEVYNQRWAHGSSPWAIAGDYVIWFFGMFGFIFGVGLKSAESLLLPVPDASFVLLYGAAIVGATISVPTALYILASWMLHGHSGCRPVERCINETGTQ